jgi:hypothetical protein
MLKSQLKKSLIAITFASLFLTGCGGSSSSGGENSLEEDLSVPFTYLEWINKESSESGLETCSDGLSNDLLEGNWVNNVSDSGIVISDTCLSSDYGFGDQEKTNSYIVGLGVPEGNYAYIYGVSTVSTTDTVIDFGDITNQTQVINTDTNEFVTGFIDFAEGNTWDYILSEDNNTLTITLGEFSYIYDRKL